jgi:hypothetical protein
VKNKKTNANIYALVGFMPVISIKFVKQVYFFSEPLIEISKRRLGCKQAITAGDLGPGQVTMGCAEPTPFAVINFADTP